MIPLPSFRGGNRAMSSVDEEAGRSFLQNSDRLIQQVLTRLDLYDPDEIEAESSEGVVKMTFADGTKCILNRQSAARQIWLAEGAKAWHFAWEASQARWVDTKGRGGLWSVLADILSRKLGRAIDLS